MEPNNFLLYFTLALAPSLAICIFIYWKDKYEREPKLLLIGSYFLGLVIYGMFSYVFYNYLYDLIGLKELMKGMEMGSLKQLPHVVSFAFLETILIYLPIRLILYKSKSFNEPYDGITYSVMYTMGFVSLIYIQNYSSIETFLSVFWNTATLSISGIIIGYYLGLEKCLSKKNEGLKGFLLAFLLAIPSFTTPVLEAKYHIEEKNVESKTFQFYKSFWGG
ncbi:MAG: PrsW family glutamic-type intramembrane protease, partial [Bacteroidota bacterium]